MAKKDSFNNFKEAGEELKRRNDDSGFNELVRASMGNDVFEREGGAVNDADRDIGKKEFKNLGAAANNENKESEKILEGKKSDRNSEKRSKAVKLPKARINNIEELKAEANKLLELDDDYFNKGEKQKYEKIIQVHDSLINKIKGENLDEVSLKKARNKLKGIEEDLSLLLNRVHNKGILESNLRRSKNAGKKTKAPDKAVEVFKEESLPEAEIISEVSEETLPEAEIIGEVGDGDEMGGEKGDIEILKSTKEIAMERASKLVAEEKSLPEAEVIGEAEDEKIKSAEIDEASMDDLLKDFKLSKEDEKKLEKEGSEVRKDIENMPEEERRRVALGIRNIGFFVQEYKSNLFANLFDKFSNSKSETGRFFAALAETYRKDEQIAIKHIEEREKKGGVLKKAQNIGYLWSNIVKIGRPVADVLGWTASPLKFWALPGLMFFSRGAAAAKEARLRNEEVINKTRISDINEAADQAWKIYELAKLRSGGGEVNKETLEKIYEENLPQDLLERLKKSEPGTAGGILQKILRKDIEFAIKHGKFSEASFNLQLKEFDRMVSQYGIVDGLAMGARYMESMGKIGVAAVQIETAYLLMKRLPEIMHNLSNFAYHQEGETIISVRHPVPTASEQLSDINTKEKVAAISQEILKNYQEKLATVKEGEGMWHAVYRQLEDQLKDNPAKFGLSQEDLHNVSKIKNVLNHQTGKLLAEQGFIKSDGTEVRILKPGVQVLLDNHNKISVGGGEKLTYLHKAAEAVSKVIKENGYNSFNSKNLADQERIINLYNHDIFAMEENLARGLGDAREIGKLKTLRDSLLESPEYIRNQQTMKVYMNFLEKETGLKQGEYDALKKIKVGEFLEKNQKKGFLGFLSVDKKQAGLAKIIDSFKLSEQDKSFLTVDQAIKNKIGNTDLNSMLDPHFKGLNSNVEALISGKHQEGTNKILSAAEKAQGLIKDKAAGLSDSVKGVFGYENGKVVSFVSNRPASLLDAQGLLKDNWHELVINHSSGNSYLNVGSVENTAMAIFQHKEALKLLEQKGEGSSKEAEFLKKFIKYNTDLLEKRYGDIFK